jgi:hypothetical protein
MLKFVYVSPHLTFKKDAPNLKKRHKQRCNKIQKYMVFFLPGFKSSKYCPFCPIKNVLKVQNTKFLSEYENF